MPQFIVLFQDDDAHADQRHRHLAAHLAFLESHADAIIAAGPLIDPASAGPGGGLWVVQADHATRIEALVTADPLWATGLRKSYRILRWNQVFRDGLRLIRP